MLPCTLMYVESEHSCFVSHVCIVSGAGSPLPQHTVQRRLAQSPKVYVDTSRQAHHCGTFRQVLQAVASNVVKKHCT